MFHYRNWIGLLILVGGLMLPGSAMAAGQGAVGTFSTPARSGKVRFVAVKRVAQINGYQGNMTISGKTYPGVMYGLRDGRLAFVWYYASDYSQAGQAILSRMPDSSYSGTITFLDRRGNTAETGGMTVTVVF